MRDMRKTKSKSKKAGWQEEEYHINTICDTQLNSRLRVGSKTLKRDFKTVQN